MKEIKEKEYEECMKMIHELMEKWEKIRPSEELLVMILPKYEQEQRKKRMEQVCEMILKEKW